MDAGTYELYEDRKMEVTNFIVLRPNEQTEWEQKFWDRFPEAISYSVDEKELIIWYEDKYHWMKFERQK